MTNGVAHVSRKKVFALPLLSTLLTSYIFWSIYDVLPEIQFVLPPTIAYLRSFPPRMRRGFRNSVPSPVHKCEVDQTPSIAPVNEDGVSKNLVLIARISGALTEATFFDPMLTGRRMETYFPNINTPPIQR